MEFTLKSEHFRYEHTDSGWVYIFDECDKAYPLWIHGDTLPELIALLQQARATAHPSEPIPAPPGAVGPMF